MSDKPNILVSGGAGYIGSHTALALDQAGFIPVVVDSLVTGHEWATKFGPFQKGDVGDPYLIRNLCATYSPVALIHFAAFIEVGESVREPEKYFENNTVKASILFDTALDCGVKHVVFSSTAAVYGAVQSDKPILETQAQSPINPYGESKLRAEKYLQSLSAKGLSSVILRYFNASGAAAPEFGVGEAHWPETHLIPNAILAATVPQRKLSVFGTDYPTPDGTAVRDYIHVEDLADAHVRALQYLIEGGHSEVCNLGTGTGNSVREIIAAVEATTGKTVNKEFSARREGDPAFLVADYHKAQELLGWTPQKNIEDIVRSAALWHEGKRYQDLLLQKTS